MVFGKSDAGFGWVLTLRNGARCGSLRRSAISPSPSCRGEREGPTPQAREGEGIVNVALTQLAPLATLSLNAGEGLSASSLRKQLA